MTTTTTTTTRRAILAGAVSLPALTLALPAVAVAAVKSTASSAPPSKATLEAYLEWLDCEARLLGRELYPELRGRFIPANTAAAHFHFFDGWQYGPMPSTRANAVLNLVGVEIPPADRVPPMPAAIDPIFDAIDRHRIAAAEFSGHVEKQWALEETIPPERRMNFYVHDRYNASVGKDDDPRWTEFQAEYWRLVDRTDDVELDLISIQPTTTAGVVALLRYVAQYEKHSAFIERVLNAAGEEESWHEAIQHHIADSLEAMQVQS